MRAIALVATTRLAGAKALLHAHSGRLHIAARGAPTVSAFECGLIADHIITVSTDGLHTLEDAGARAELLANGVDTSAFPNPSATLPSCRSRPSAPSAHARASTTFASR